MWELVIWKNTYHILLEILGGPDHNDDRQEGHDVPADTHREVADNVGDTGSVEEDTYAHEAVGT